jgi:hypothetical protein
MAAVNACFVPDDGAAVATNGGAGHQQTVSSTTNAESTQQSAGCWSGNDTFIDTNAICRPGTIFTELPLVLSNFSGKRFTILHLFIQIICDITLIYVKVTTGFE